jgi:Skp family chaperone for outer membrane proteins
MKTVLSFVFTILFANNTFAAANSSSASGEVMCRAKAKEIAASTYSGCMDEYNTAQVKAIREAYQKDLAAMKAKYDKKLKALKKGSSNVNATNTANAAKPAKGVAHELPSKTVNQSETAPVISPTSEEPVVALKPTSDAALENEAVLPDQNDLNETTAQ